MDPILVKQAMHRKARVFTAPLRRQKKFDDMYPCPIDQGQSRNQSNHHMLPSPPLGETNLAHTHHSSERSSSPTWSLFSAASSSSNLAEKGYVTNKQFSTRRLPSISYAGPSRTPKQFRRSSAPSPELWVSKPSTDAVMSLPSWHLSTRPLQAENPCKWNSDIVALNPSEGLQHISFIVDNTEHNVVTWSPKDEEDQQEADQEDELDICMAQEFEFDVQEDPALHFTPMMVDEPSPQNSSPVASGVVPKLEEPASLPGASWNQANTTATISRSPPVAAHYPASVLHSQPPAQIKQEVKHEFKSEPETDFHSPLFPTDHAAIKCTQKWRTQLRGICLLAKRKGVSEETCSRMVRKVDKICYNIVHAINDGSKLMPSMVYGESSNGEDSEGATQVMDWLGLLLVSELAHKWCLEATLRSTLDDCSAWRDAHAVLRTEEMKG